MSVHLSKKFICSSLIVCVIVVIIYLCQAEILDQRIFSRYRKGVNGLSENGSFCDAKDGKVDCFIHGFSARFESIRKFLLFQCALIIIGLVFYVVIHERERHWDQKLVQKVNRQIAAGV
ncbi:hypothetical protein PHET_09362 [Paragonimus heterotremus]|uniref:Uncharacterized protein n=1 Tax=Paragonimus heterotremus TaxID=100268 RepID=A0A8J4TB41_9TREM|nr:hypothetical protein PHET_09362 [Paragonimus heterotremus]